MIAKCSLYSKLNLVIYEMDIIPVLQTKKLKHSEVSQVAQGYLVVRDVADVQTLAAWL